MLQPDGFRRGRLSPSGSMCLIQEAPTNSLYDKTFFVSIGAAKNVLFVTKNGKRPFYIKTRQRVAVTPAQVGKMTPPGAGLLAWRALLAEV